MKKLTFLALMLISFSAFAQSKFIEVEVTDTITLKPLNFQFNVYVNDDDEVVVYNEDDVEDYDPLAELEKSKNKLQNIKKLLENKKYKTEPLDESKANFLDKRFSMRESQGFTVRVSGQAEMQKLKDLLDAQKDAKTVIAVTKYADELKAEEQLIKKLMDSAKARAAVIGLNSGLKPGRILEVKEGKKSTDFNMNDFYSQIMKMGMMGQNGGNYTGSLSKTFVVKFTAE
jgi:hypothetical protein